MITIGKEPYAPRADCALRVDAFLGRHQLRRSGGALGGGADDRGRIPYLYRDPRLFPFLLFVELRRLPDLVGFRGGPGRAARDNRNRPDDLVSGDDRHRFLYDVADAVREPARHGCRRGQLVPVDRAIGAGVGAGGPARAIPHDRQHRQLRRAGIADRCFCHGREPLWLAPRLFRHRRSRVGVAACLGDLVPSAGRGRR